MNTANHLSQDSLALLALESLPAEETRAAREHLQACEICRAELAAFHGDLALFSLGVEESTPAPAARERLLRQIALESRVGVSHDVHPGEAEEAPALDTTRAAPADGASRVLPFVAPAAAARTQSRLALWSGWAVAAALAVAVGLQVQQRQRLQNQLAAEHAELSGLQQSAAAAQGALLPLTDPAAVNVSLQQPAALKGANAQHSPTGHAAYLPDRGALVFVATDLEPLKPYKVYELWLLPAEKGKAPVPAASFRPDAAGHANVILPTGPKAISVAGFGVTVEDDKSSMQKPTLPILLMGTSKS